MRTYIIRTMIAGVLGAHSYYVACTDEQSVHQDPAQLAAVQKIIDRNAKTVDHYSDPEVIQELVDKADAIAQRYTSHEFLHAIINAEKIRIERQIAWNNQILCSHKFTIPFINYSITPALKHGDVCLIASNLTQIATDWAMYQGLQALSNDFFPSWIKEHQQEVSGWIAERMLCQTQEDRAALIQKITTAMQESSSDFYTKALIACMAKTSVMAWMIDGTVRHYQLHKFPATAGIVTRIAAVQTVDAYATGTNPLVPVMNVCKGKFDVIMPFFATTSQLGEKIFENLLEWELLPDWYKNWYCTMAKVVICQALFARWFFSSVQIPMFAQALVNKDISVLQGEQKPDGIRAFCSQVTTLSFKTWTSMKSAFTMRTRALLSIILCAPAAVKAAQWVYTMAQKLSSDTTQKEPS